MAPQAGGNAVDAAIATSLCQGVVNPAASGVGGGHFMVVRMANGTAWIVNAREQAPAGASKDMYTGVYIEACMLGKSASYGRSISCGKRYCWLYVGYGRQYGGIAAVEACPVRKGAPRLT